MLGTGVLHSLSCFCYKDILFLSVAWVISEDVLEKQTSLKSRFLAALWQYTNLQSGYKCLSVFMTVLLVCWVLVNAFSGCYEEMHWVCTKIFLAVTECESEKQNTIDSEFTLNSLWPCFCWLTSLGAGSASDYKLVAMTFTVLQYSVIKKSHEHLT